MTTITAPPITKSIFNYPPNFPAGVVNPDWISWFQAVQANSLIYPAPQTGFALGWDANGNLVNVANTGADQTAAWTAADAVVTANFQAADAGLLSGYQAGDIAIRSDLLNTAVGKGAALISYLAPYTGAAARTLQSKVSDTVSILDFAGADTTGATASDTAVASAITAAVEVHFPAGHYKINTNATFIERVVLADGAYFDIATGITLTFNGGIQAPRTAWIFRGLGTAAFGTGVQGEYSACWFGMIPSQTPADNGTYFNKAAAQIYGNTMRIPRGTYQLAGGAAAITPIAGGTSALPWALVGDGADANGGNGGTVLQVIGAGHGITLNNATAYNQDAFCSIRDLVIAGDGTTGTGDGLWIYKCNNLTLENLWVQTCRGNGVYMQKCYGSALRRCVILNNAKNGLYAYDSNNAVDIDSCKIYSNGKLWDGNATANIFFHGGVGLENLGINIKNTDVSYSGNVKFTIAGATLTSIVVAAGTATVTTAAAHGLTTGDIVSVYGCTSAAALNTVEYGYTITVTGPNTFTFATGAGAGTYTDATLGVYPNIAGIYLNYVLGFSITDLYAEECSWQSAFISNTCSGGTINGGYCQGGTSAGKIVIADARNVVVRGVFFTGAYAGSYCDMTVERHGVDVSNCTYSSGATETVSAVFMRGGTYFSNAAPAAGTWKVSDVVKNSAPTVGQPQGWVCTAVPTTFVSEGNL